MTCLIGWCNSGGDITIKSKGPAARKQLQRRHLLSEERQHSFHLVKCDFVVGILEIHTQHLPFL
jgi:hypothetical protein